MVLPAAPNEAVVDDLVRLTLEVALEAYTVADDWLEVTACVYGSTPDAVAVLVTDPASTSAWVAVYVPVHVSLIWEGSVGFGQLTPVTWSSATAMPVRESGPVLVTT